MPTPYSKKEPLFVYAQEFSFTDNDRLTYVYKRNLNKKIVEVTNVSYETKLNGKWITLIRYDSAHGYLHKHITMSLHNMSDAPSRIGVKKRGTHATWLTWSINDIKRKFQLYRHDFLKRSNLQHLLQNY